MPKVKDLANNNTSLTRPVVLVCLALLGFVTNLQAFAKTPNDKATPESTVEARALPSASEVVSSQLVVVVNAANQLSELSKKDIVDIFMGRFNTFPNGESAEPIDSPKGSNEKKAFYEVMVGKDERKIQAYWSRLLFSGRAQPPIAPESKEELLALVSESEGAIAYLPLSEVTQEMKVVYEL